MRVRSRCTKRGSRSRMPEPVSETPLVRSSKRPGADPRGSTPPGSAAASRRSGGWWARRNRWLTLRAARHPLRLVALRSGRRLLNVLLRLNFWRLPLGWQCRRPIRPRCGPVSAAGLEREERHLEFERLAVLPLPEKEAVDHAPSAVDQGQNKQATHEGGTRDTREPGEEASDRHAQPKPSAGPGASSTDRFGWCNAIVVTGGCRRVWSLLLRPTPGDWSW